MLDNPWFVGIAGSAIVSIFLPLVVNLFSNKDYDLNVKRANSELINLLIMSTAEEKLPNQAVVEALINSSAKKYSVRLNDIHSVNDTYDDLIRAIYETNFIPIDKKQIIANQLSDMKIVISDEEKVKQRPPELFELRRTKVYLYMFFLLTIGLSFAFYKEKLNGEFTWSTFKELSFDDLFLAGGLAGIVISFAMSRYAEFKMKNRKEKINSDTYKNTHQY